MYGGDLIINVISSRTEKKRLDKNNAVRRNEVVGRKQIL